MFLAFVIAAWLGAADAPSAPAFFSQGHVDQALRSLVVALDKNDEKAEVAAIDTLRAVQHGAGWLNSFAQAAVLERKATEWLSERPQLAKKAALYARELSPSSVQAEILVIRSELASREPAYGQLFRELSRLVRLSVTDFPIVAQVLGNIAFGLLAVLAAVCLIVLGLSLFRHLRYVSHDLMLLLPAGASFWHGLGLVALLVMAPLSLRLGVVGVAMALFLPTVVHSESKERFTTTLALIIIAVLPLSFGPIAQLWTMPSGRARDLYEVTRGQQDAAAEQRLRDDLARLDDASSRIALGSAKLLRGHYEAARDELKVAVEKGPQHHEAWVQLGVAQLQLDDVAAAQRSFEEAVTVNPNSVPALFDLSRMFFREAKHDKGNQAYNRAQALDADRTNGMVAISRALGPRYVATDVLPLRHLLRADPYPSERLQQQAMVAAMNGVYSGGLTPWILAVAALGYALVGAVIASLGQRATPALPCPRCGRPVCIHTDKELPDRSLCGQCFHAFVVNDVDTKTRIGKELECIRYERRRSTLLRLSSLMLAGSGHVLAGRPLRGALLLSFSTAAILTMAFASSLMPLPARWTSGESSFFVLAVALLFWLVVSLLAAVTVPTKDV